MKVIRSLLSTVISLVLAVSSLATCVAAPALFSDAASSDPYSLVLSYYPDNGAYRIRGAGGLYLTVHDSEPVGDASGGENGKSATSTDDRQEDGGYDGSAELSLSEERDDRSQLFVLYEKSRLSFTVASEQNGLLLAAEPADDGSCDAGFSASDGTLARFSVIRLEDGRYMISPNNTKDQALCLTAEGEDLFFSDYIGKESQKWHLEPVAITSVSISDKELLLRPGETFEPDYEMSPAKLTDMLVWRSSNDGVASVDRNGRITAHRNGTAVISASVGELSAECSVTVSSVMTSAFFSQHNFTNGGWDCRKLMNLRFSSKKFLIEHYNYNQDWMDEGCMLCCVSILLSNLGAKMTTGYDLRTDKTDDLDADPYTVALANTGNYGAKSQYANLYGHPVLMDLSRVLTRFTVNGDAIAFNRKNWTVSQADIKNALDEHPEGVIVGFYQSNDLQHFMVFTECVNPEDESGNYKFLVCDPAAYDRSDGDHVPFEDSLTYKLEGYRYRHISSLFTFSVLSGYSGSASLIGNRVRDSRIK